MAAPDGWWRVDVWTRRPGVLGHERRRREVRTREEARDWVEALSPRAESVLWFEDERRVSVLVGR